VASGPAAKEEAQPKINSNAMNLIKQISKFL